MTKINIILIASAMFWGMLSCQSKDEEAATKIPETPVVTTPPEQPKPENPMQPVEPVTPEKPENPPTTNDNISQDIAGTWIKDTVYYDDNGDTIVFTNDYKIEKYFKYYESKGYWMGYRIKTDTVSISANSEDFSAELSFKYSIQGDKLIIFWFTNPFVTSCDVRKDVVFRKFQ